MSHGDHGTFGRSSEIDEKATAYLRAKLCLPFFMIRRWAPDPFLDYQVEVVEKREPTARFTFVQLKGQEKVSRSGNEVTYALPTKHLRYYQEKVREPVWLVLVDVTSGIGYFLFLQEWIDRNTTNETLAQQQSLTVKIPESNRLDVTPLFRDRLTYAIRYMQAKHPGTVDDAIAAEVKRLSAIDPRFSASVHVMGPMRRLLFQAKEPVRVDIKLALPNEPAASAKLEKLVGLGQRATFAPGEISIDGTPLLAAMAQAPVALEPAQSAPSELIVTDKTHGLLFVATGRSAVGTQGMTFEGGLPESPLTLRMTVTRDCEKGTDMGEVRLAWDFAAWVGRPAASLGYAEVLRNFAIAVVEQQPIDAELRINGERTTMGSFKPGPPSLHDLGVRDMLGLLNEARAIALAIRKELRVPEMKAINDGDRDDIETCFDLLKSGVHVTMAKEISIRATYRARLEEELPALLRGDSVARPLEVTFPGHQFRIFGETFDLGRITFRFASATIEIGEENLTQFQTGITDEIAAVFRSSPDTTLEIRRDGAQV